MIKYWEWFVSWYSSTNKYLKRSMNHVLVNPVDVNGNGTSGYLIKNGPNKGKVLKHLIVKHQNKF